MNEHADFGLDKAGLMAANEHQGSLSLRYFIRQKPEVKPPFKKSWWRPGHRPEPSSKFAAQFMLSVSFVEAPAMSAVGHQETARLVARASLARFYRSDKPRDPSSLNDSNVPHGQPLFHRTAWLVISNVQIEGLAENEIRQESQEFNNPHAVKRTHIGQSRSNAVLAW